MLASELHNYQMVNLLGVVGYSKVRTVIPDIYFKLVRFGSPGKS